MGFYKWFIHQIHSGVLQKSCEHSEDVIIHNLGENEEEEPREQEARDLIQTFAHTRHATFKSFSFIIFITLQR